MEKALVAANFMMVVVTLLLVFVTWRYTKHKQKIAEIALMDYKLWVETNYQILCDNISIAKFGLTGNIRIKNTVIVPIFVKNRKIIAIELIENRIQNPTIMEEPNLEIIKHRK